MRQLEYLMRMRERHGAAFISRLTEGGELVVVGAPELAKEVFTAPTDVLHAGEGNRRVLDQFLGEHSLILLDGNRHIDHRRILLPPLHGRRLARQAAPIRRLVRAQLDAWPTGEEIATLPRLRELALAVVLRSVFGGRKRARALGERLRTLLLPGDPNGEASVSLHSFRRAEKLVAAEVAAQRGDSGIEERNSILAILLEARRADGLPLTDAEVRDELMTLVLAGSETTASSLAWALERLARTPAALAAAGEDAAAGEGAYIDAVVKETLRARPVVPMSARMVKRPFRLNGRSIDPGAVIAVSALLIHHGAQIYPEPMSFRPERFLAEQPGTYEWIPFGGGTRRCLGSSFALQEMRIVLRCLLARMEPTASDLEPEGMSSRGNTMVPARGARLILEARDG